MYPTIISPIIRKSCITLAFILLSIAGNAAPAAQPLNGIQVNEEAARLGCSCLTGIHMFFNTLDGNGGIFQLCMEPPPTKNIIAKKPNGDIEAFLPNTSLERVKEILNLGLMIKCRCKQKKQCDF